MKRKTTKLDYILVLLAFIAGMSYLFSIYKPPMKMSQDEFDTIAKAVIAGQDGWVIGVDINPSRHELILTNKEYRPADYQIQPQNLIARYWCRKYPQFDKVTINFRDNRIFGWYNCKK